MKPTLRSAADKRRFPPTDYFFQSGMGDWRGYSSPSGEDGSEFRNFCSLSRECLREAARERAKEMWVFALVVLTAAWPVIYTIVTVVRLLSKGRPMDQ